MHQGHLKFEYKGSLKKIAFSIDVNGYGGLPLIVIMDKNKHSYNFIRVEHVGWRAIGKEPNWPRDFLDMLYYAFEEKLNEFL